VAEMIVREGVLVAWQGLVEGKTLADKDNNC
jgi:hypothetical protein